MPELPEVQTVVTDLNEKIKGDTIVSFWSEWPRAIKGLNLDKFKKEIQGRKILGVRRIGKNIFIDLSGEKTLYIHLKMTGHLLVKLQNPNDKLQTLPAGRQVKFKSKNSKNKKINYFNDKVNQYIRHKWFLKSDLTPNPSPCKGEGGKVFDKTLEFSDVRKFAKIVLDSTQKINSLKEIEALGIDAMDKNFTFKKFEEILEKKSRSPIGLVLMDQNLIAGIGNIYRSEILFDAKINPKKIVGKINLDEKRKIYNSIKKILEKAIKLRGTSDSDYRDTSGAPGNFQKVLKVYRRDKTPCANCNAKIQRAVLAQRAIFFCPKCQK